MAKETEQLPQADCLKGKNIREPENEIDPSIIGYSPSILAATEAHNGENFGELFGMVKRWNL
jgi:hypothetical protein